MVICPPSHTLRREAKLQAKSSRRAGGRAGRPESRHTAPCPPHGGGTRPLWPGALRPGGAQPTGAPELLCLLARQTPSSLLCPPESSIAAPAVLVERRQVASSCCPGLSWPPDKRALKIPAPRLVTPGPPSGGPRPEHWFRGGKGAPHTHSCSPGSRVPLWPPAGPAQATDAGQPPWRRSPLPPPRPQTAPTSTHCRVWFPTPNTWVRGESISRCRPGSKLVSDPERRTPNDLVPPVEL